MVTYKQLQKKTRKFKLKTNRKRALQGNPQKKAHCLRVYKTPPKKPNSARRSVARVGLNNFLKVTAYIPGENHNLQKYSCVLLRGGRVPDLPGVFYKIIRGKYDCHSVLKRKKSRSIYGTKK
jgi:small subunit ribosomal protein S12